MRNLQCPCWHITVEWIEQCKICLFICFDPINLNAKFTSLFIGYQKSDLLDLVRRDGRYIAQNAPSEDWNELAERNTNIHPGFRLSSKAIPV